MTSDSVNQLVKLIQGKMQKEFDALNDEIGLEDKYKAPLSESMLEEEDTNKEEDFEHLDASCIDQNESVLSQGCVSDNDNNSVLEEESKKSK